MTRQGPPPFYPDPMPTAPPRRCPNMGCPNTAPCPTHTRRPWQGSTRKQTLPPDWAQRRTLVLTRAGGRCQCQGCTPHTGPCTQPAQDVDHRTPGTDHSLDNLQALCRTCHTTKTQQEAAAARRTRRY